MRAPTALILALLPLAIAAFAQDVPQQPRQLNQRDMAQLRTSVERSKARSAQAVADERSRRQELERQRQINDAIAAEQQAQADAEAEAEAEAQRQQVAERWDRQKREGERALSDSLRNLNGTVSAIQERQRAATHDAESKQDAADVAQRQPELANARRATELQDEIARQNDARRQARSSTHSPLDTSGSDERHTCKVAQRTVLPSAGQGDTREAAEADVRGRADRACGPDGVSDYGLANACTQQVGVRGNRYWMCTPRVQCNATEKKCANTPSEGSKQ